MNQSGNVFPTFYQRPNSLTLSDTHLGQVLSAEIIKSMRLFVRQEGGGGGGGQPAWRQSNKLTLIYNEELQHSCREEDKSCRKEKREKHLKREKLVK